MKPLDEEYLLVVDSGNNCVRKVHRSSGRAEEFAGTCGSTRFDGFNGTVKATDAMLDGPKQALLVTEQNIIYYFLTASGNRACSIVLHNLTTGIY